MINRKRDNNKYKLQMFKKRSLEIELIEKAMANLDIVVLVHLSSVTIRITQYLLALTLKGKLPNCVYLELMVLKHYLQKNSMFVIKKKYIHLNWNKQVERKLMIELRLHLSAKIRIPSICIDFAQEMRLFLNQS